MERVLYVATALLLTFFDILLTWFFAKKQKILKPKNWYDSEITPLSPLKFFWKKYNLNSGTVYGGVVNLIIAFIIFYFVSFLSFHEYLLLLYIYPYLLHYNSFRKLRNFL